MITDECRHGWWIITPWKRKYLGVDLPESVKKRAELLRMDGLGCEYDVYQFNYAVVMFR